jgi:hypothetical protein
VLEGAEGFLEARQVGGLEGGADGFPAAGEGGEFWDKFVAFVSDTLLKDADQLAEEYKSVGGAGYLLAALFGVLGIGSLVLLGLVNINETTLGVHVRLTTMSLHNHVPVTIENYFDAVDKELESGRWNGIYVSTDNVESLVKMEQKYSRWIRYYPNLLRLPKETIGNDNEWAWEYDMFFHKKFWQESFMEAMTLAKCGGLVCRDSNFSNAAIVFSDTIKQVIRVGS